MYISHFKRELATVRIQRASTLSKDSNRWIFYSALDPAHINPAEVRFSPKATELPRGSEMPRCAISDITRRSETELIEQCFCLLQIARVEPLSEPPVNRSE